MASLLSALPDVNVSYYTIPVAMFVAMFPRWWGGLAGKGKKFFNKANPRSYVNQLSKSELEPKVRDQLMRAEYCSANGFEGLPLYAAAVTAGNSSGLSAQTMTLCSGIYLLARVWYTYEYIWGPDNRTDGKPLKSTPRRSRAWGVGTLTILGLFIAAGRQM